MFSADEAGQEAPGAGSGQLDQIMESISALASSVAILQFQADREQRLPHKGASKADTLRRAQTRQARVIFPPDPTPSVLISSA